uniref:Uncharacterized protein n=1 Tax=Romanomermis culicivorax TaxID=13658 RepID=A0A915J3U0_ROMCU
MCGTSKVDPALFISKKKAETTAPISPSIFQTVADKWRVFSSGQKISIADLFLKYCHMFKEDFDQILNLIQMDIQGANTHSISILPEERLTLTLKHHQTVEKSIILMKNYSYPEPKLFDGQQDRSLKYFLNSCTCDYFPRRTRNLNNSSPIQISCARSLLSWNRFHKVLAKSQQAKSPACVAVMRNRKTPS